MTKNTNKITKTRSRKAPLENLLNKANEELSHLEQLVANKKSQIADIESQIRDRDMKDLYAYATNQGYSIEAVKSFIDNQKGKIASKSA